MKKLFTLIMCLSVSIISVHAQKNNSLNYESPNSPIDNVSHWVEMAQRGIVSLNPSIPVAPATELGSMVESPDILQNSPDVLVLNITNNTQSENSVFVDPNNANHVLNSNNSEQSGTIYGASYINTTDGGLTWSGSKFGAGGSDKGDPAACIGLNGRQYIGAINTSRKQVVSYSDNGTSWTKVNLVSGTIYYPDLYDKNHLWIDNTNSGQSGNIYDAWTHFESGHTNDTQIEFSRSVNNGASWTTPYQISSGVSAGAFNQGVNIQCNNTGWVFAVWAIHDDWSAGNYAEDAIGFARSPNGGASFYSANRIVNNIKGIRESSSVANATGKNMRVNSFPSMALDVSGGTYHGHIYVVWANQGVPGTNTGTNVSVYMVQSTNGVAWTTPVRVNTVGNANHAAFFPWITCDPVTGNLYCIFYDDRNLSAGSSAVETWLAYSTDGGASWNDMRVSDISFTPSPIPGLATGYFGDYLGVTACGGLVYPTWTDNRSGRALTYVSPLNFGGSCIASGGCDEYISRVQLGTIDNSTGCDGYADYRTISTDQPLNVPSSLTVTNGNPIYSSDQCGVWVDWNKDGDFDDANETISVANTPSVGPYTATITPPASATLGAVTMRVRITYTGAVDPCGTTTYGEVEDYTINLTAKVPNEWTGAFNKYWHNSQNWSLGHIPTADEDVIITSAGYQPPKVDLYDEECNNLNIQTGVTLNIHAQTLTTNGNITINGTLGMIADNANIVALGNVVWNSGSSANITVLLAFINVYGNWNFNPGANANLTNGFVDFKGPSSCWIRAYSANSGFYNMRVYKTGGAVAKISNLSTQDLVVNNLTFISTGAILKSFSDNNVVMKGAFNYYGSFDFTAFSNTGGVVFDGTTQGITKYSTSSGIFNNVVFSSTTGTTLNGDDLIVMGDLTIESGYFNSNGNAVEVHGNWNNTGGTYTPSGSIVTFNGSGSAQDVNGTSTFYDVVQLNTGSYLRFNNPNTISNNLELHFYCWAYDVFGITGTLNLNDPASKFSVYGGAIVNAGALDQGGQIVVSASSITVNDLLESGMEGTYLLHSGTINLTQDAGSFPDFRADITIEDGQFILNGGAGTSWWAYSGDASLTMSGGIFDFNNAGCNIYNSSYLLTLNITGGTIRSAGDFLVANPVFTPSIGTIELYSANDGYFSTVIGTNVFDIIINKATKSGGNTFTYSDRDLAAGITPSGKAPLANTVSMTSDTYINGDFTITSGIFNTGISNMYVAANWTNSVGDAGFLENTNTVNFVGSGLSQITTNETFYNLVQNNTSINYNALQLNAGLTANVLNNLSINDGKFELKSNSTLTVGNNVYIALDCGLNAWGDTGLHINVGGNWTNDNTTWDTGIGYSPDTEIITFNGSGDQIITTAADREDFGNLYINKPSGEFRSNDSINVLHDFNMANGVWHDNAVQLTHYFQGNFYIAAGASAMWNSLTGNTVVFKGLSDQTVFNPFGTGYFNKFIVDKTGFAAKKQDISEGAEMLAISGGEELLSGSQSSGSKGINTMTVSLTSDLDIEGSGSGMTIKEGTLNLNGSTFWTTGDVNINNGGVLSIDANALLRVKDGFSLNVNNGGVLQVIGTSGNNAKISNRLSGYYAFKVFFGGTLSAEYATLEYMDWFGAYILSGGIVDPAHAFNYCTFQNVQATSSASVVTLSNDQVLTSTGANFPDNPYYNIYKSNALGSITFNSATGDFAGAEYEYDPNGLVNWGNVDVDMDLTLMLEGPYNGSTMNTGLNALGLIPLSQPFGSNSAADWYYTGAESVAAIPPNAVDWVLVQIRDAANPASALPGTIVAQQAAFLLANGSVVDLDGSSHLMFTGITDNNGLFPVIWHRNHLGIMSSAKIVRTAGIFSYDFTPAGAAYSNTSQGEKSLGGGVYGMFAGDASGGGMINSYDDFLWQLVAGSYGYLAEDYNMNGQADNIDKNDLWLDNIGKSSQISGSKSSD